jgi:2'-5' RNA ligase
VRAFLAIPVIPPALDDGVQLLDRLRATLPDVRWVRSEGLHLTLHFFENLRDDAVDTVLDAPRAAAAHHTTSTAQLGGLGCFPRDGDERVLWIGMLDGADRIAALQRDVEQHLAAQGFPTETRAFTPHVTLGRPRARFTDAQRRRWLDLRDTALRPFTIDRLTLYRSHPGPGGSRYEVLGSVPLLSAAP